MRNSRRFALAPLVVACLAFTGTRSARADSDPLFGDVIEDSFAPHRTFGTTARLGTSVGFVYGEPRQVLAFGGTIAVGRRIGRLAFEAEYTYLSLQTYGDVMTTIGTVQDNVTIGSGHRAALLARYDVVRLESHAVGPNSMIALYLEGGVGLAWNHWDLPTADEPSRLVPTDTRRVEGQAGIGLMLDHRLQEPIGFPKRVGWFLGWRVAMTPHQPMSAAICRGVSCSAVPAMDAGNGSVVDRSMLFQSSLEFTF